MNKNLKRMVFIAIYVALTMVLDYTKEMLPFLNMPQGGSVNIALIPIVFASFHLGSINGLIAGLLWWAISSIMGLNNYFLNIMQYILDYIVPSTIIGLASIFYWKKNSFEAIIGIVFVMAIRTLSILLSGAYYWAGDLASGSKEAWIASLAYNLPYSIATCLMLVVVVTVTVKVLYQQVMMLL